MEACLDNTASALVGCRLPALRLPSTHGAVDLAQATEGSLVLFVYPRTGLPREPQPPGWEDIPGARGCTAESCAFRDRTAQIRELGAAIMGLSAQPAVEQHEFAQRERIPYPLLNDSRLALARQLGLPIFAVDGRSFYRRLTLIAAAGQIAKVFYPIVSPERHPQEVVAWLDHVR